MRLLIIFLGVLFLMTGCTQKYHLSPVSNGNETQVIFNHGREVAVSDECETRFFISGTKESSSELVLHVLYLNNSDSKTMTIYPDKISVMGYNQSGITKTFKTYSADEYLRKLRRSQMWTTILRALSGALNAYNAGQSTSTTYSTTSGNIYGSTGNSYMASGTTMSTTNSYDHRATVEANNRNQRNLDRLSKRQSNAYKTLEQSLIKTNTLFPKSHVEGNIIVKVDNTYTKKFVVTVPFGEETHVITFVPKSIGTCSQEG